MNKLAFILLLAGFWVLNSGYFSPLLLGFGVVSVAVAAALAWRMQRFDSEMYPFFMPSWKLPGYLVWMLGQIVKANIDVIRRIWRGKGAISPVIFTCRTDAESEIGKTLFANSITMTPGTVTLSINDNEIKVHALSREAAEILLEGEMNRRVAELENGIR